MRWGLVGLPFMIPESFDVVIIGGGIAGLSTALHLAQAGARRICLLDRERVPGFYASGRCAGIARQLTGQPQETVLTVEGRNRLDEVGLLGEGGGLLLCAEPGGLERLQREASAFALPVEFGEGSGVPGLNAAAHLRVASDGIIDVNGLLRHCVDGAREAGVVLRYGDAVEAIRADGTGFEVQCAGGPLRAATLVNAAGAWAGAIGRMAGGEDIPFRTMRRHLVWSRGGAAPDVPYAWWVDRPLYLRAESGGVLLCPCDEVEVEPPLPGDQAEVDPGVLGSLCGSLTDLAPGLGDRAVDRIWAGIRTFAPDSRFVIGWDRKNPRLFWVAGLGGHGMTAGLAVGRLAVDLLLGPNAPPLLN